MTNGFASICAGSGFESAKRLVRDMLAEAARIGIGRDDIKRALAGELESK